MTFISSFLNLSSRTRTGSEIPPEGRIEARISQKIEVERTCERLIELTKAMFQKPKYRNHFDQIILEGVQKINSISSDIDNDMSFYKNMLRESLSDINIQQPLMQTLSKSEIVTVINEGPLKPETKDLVTYAINSEIVQINEKISGYTEIQTKTSEQTILLTNLQTSRDTLLDIQTSVTNEEGINYKLVECILNSQITKSNDIKISKNTEFIENNKQQQKTKAVIDLGKDRRKNCLTKEEQEPYTKKINTLSKRLETEREEGTQVKIERDSCSRYIKQLQEVKENLFLGIGE